ncbi:MAG: DUF4175 family protein [Rhabdaerophilum sp.]
MAVQPRDAAPDTKPTNAGPSVLPPRFPSWTWRRTALGLTLEAILPALLWPAAILVAFLVTAWLGLFGEIEPLWRAAITGLFGLAFLVSLKGLAGIRPPDAAAISRRLDGSRPDLHRPLATLGDRLAARGDAFAEALWQQVPGTASQHLKASLLRLALEADLVLDLHCDADAALHLYTQPRSLAAFTPLAALLGAKAILLADVSGGDPFDEALSRPWADLAKARPDRPLPAGCHAVTVELRGQADVRQDLAEADARAILGFLRHAGVIPGDRPDLPPLLCRPTLLEASEPIIAPTGGILTYRKMAGEVVTAGEILADITDPLTGDRIPVKALSAGMFYARSAETFVTPGKRLGKVAGDALRRSGRLLSP